MLAPVTGTCPHRLAHVQAALRHRAADLRDSLVLSEFLQDLQEEEARSRQGPAAVSSGATHSLGSPSTWEAWSVAGRGTLWEPPSALAAWGGTLHRPHAQCFCWFQPGSGHCGSQGSFPPLSAQAGQPPSSEDMSCPLGELQEAVEMLNDAAKERERVMEVAAETERLECLVGDGGGGSGDAAGSICSWSHRLGGTGHAPQLVPVGPEGFGIHWDCCVRGWHPRRSHGWCSLPLCRCTAGCPQAGVGWGHMASSGTRCPMPGLISLPPLPTQVAEVSPRLDALRCRAEALAHDTAQAESSFTAVKSEKDLPGLQGLLSRQQEMEVRSRRAEAVPGRCWPPGGPGAVSLGKPWRARLEFSSRAEPCPAPLPSASTGQARGESSRQLLCASAWLPAPRSSSCWQGGD